MTHKGRVSPFGNPRINGRSPLPAAYRSVLRPSSPLSAKASTKCPSTLDPTTNQHAGTSPRDQPIRSEEHTSELQSLMRISYAVFCLKKKKTKKPKNKR